MVTWAQGEASGVAPNWQSPTAELAYA